ncbi:hypothetical protein N8835_00050 [Alphaproteobacteria bacterium]|nr:hypothetical protein [Alphaproteobacteria bacterium]
MSLKSPDPRKYPDPNSPPDYPSSYYFILRRLLLCLSWLAASVGILLGERAAWLTEIGVTSFGLFVLLTLARLRWDSLAILGMLGVVAFLLLPGIPASADLLRGGAHILIFAALLPTMALVRATAMTMPSVHMTQQRLALLPAHAAASGLQIAGHIFGGIINTGAFALLSAAVPADSDLAKRRIAAEAAIRGMVSSAAWSPFFVAFAIGQNFVAPHYAWIAIGLGVVSASLFSLGSLLFLDRGFRFAKLAIALACMGPVALRLLLTLAAVLAAALIFNLTALSAVVIVMPVLVVIQMGRHRHHIRTIIHDTKTALDQTGDDIVIITSAMFVAFFAIQTDGIGQIVALFYVGVIPGWFALIAMPVLMMMASVVGIHPVITSTALFAVFSGGGADVHPALLVQSHLIGWGAGTMSSVASLSVISCASLYNVPARQLALGTNLGAGFGYAICGGGLLAVVNAFL